MTQEDAKDVDSAIPPAAKPLVPYLRSRQDALRLRQALTLYLQSHIVSEDNNSYNNSDGDLTVSHPALTLPANASVTVKRIPSEIAGVRREYLKALQENIAVKREYNDLSEKITSRQLLNGQVNARPSKPAVSGSIDVDTHSSVLSDYLALLRERRRHEKLQLFDAHLRELASAADPEEQHQSNSSTARADLDKIFKGNGYETADESGDNVQALISKLERAVVRAKAKLVKEQHLLQQLREQQANGLLDSRNKAIALGRTRDTLVQWVEEKLAITTSTEDDVMNHEKRYTDDTNTAETWQLIAERKTQIKEQYAAYVGARRSLLDAVSLLSQPTRSAALEEPSKKPPQRSSDDSIQDYSAIDAFRTVSEHILPAAKYQKSLAHQRSYLTGMLTKEKTNIKHAFDRLSQESHLLPEYPILARQSKFRHITPSSTTGSGPRQPNRDDTLQNAQAWAFAADAARSGENDYVEQRLEHGAEMADTASETLQQVYDLLHQERNPHDGETAEDAHHLDDIWTAEVQPRKARARRLNETQQQPAGGRGPWSALSGRVE
ncbi:hypothetical protein UA08_07824 [Talaromyces atroroseus]|uniref:Uncharacterized protein n=1 Tax=Talaromyces atroroseus TaxID=1441469 RepID=A0A225ADC8_TALAT|nr:hypothetical protein UA08_07824 [Talaromyces atroroseus]OKL56953.1 hypothetical protein UA08_07824 [Talaromyces atroroseus]